MLLSARRKISYPEPGRSDRPDVPAHIANLVAALEVDVIFSVGLDSDRAAAAHQVGGGRVWWSTDTLTLWYDDGTAWQHIGAPLDSPTFVGTPQAPTPPPGDNDTSIATTAFVNQFFPAGAVIDYAGGAAPVGWLICDGSAVGRVAFSGLFAVIGTTFGVGNGTTTFNLPDCRGRVTVGLNAGTFNVMGKTGGEETHVTTVAEMPGHTHSVSGTTGTENSDHTHSGTTSTASPAGSTVLSYTTNDVTSAGTSARVDNIVLGSTAHNHSITTGGVSANHNHSFSATSSSVGGGAAHNNLQPYIVFNKIIKY